MSSADAVGAKDPRWSKNNPPPDPVKVWLMTSGERRPLPGSDHRSRYQWGACATSRGRQQPGHKMFQAMTRPGLLGARDPVLGCLFGFFFSAEHRPNISQNSCYDMVCCQPYQALAFSSTSNQVHTKSQGRPLQESDAPFALGAMGRKKLETKDLGSWSGKQTSSNTQDQRKTSREQQPRRHSTFPCVV